MQTGSLWQLTHASRAHVVMLLGWVDTGSHFVTVVLFLWSMLNFLFGREVFDLGPALHSGYTEAAKQNILDGTSKWSASISLTGIPPSTNQFSYFPNMYFSFLCLILISFTLYYYMVQVCSKPTSYSTWYIILLYS